VRDQARSAAQDLSPSGNGTGTGTQVGGSTAVYDQNVDRADGTGYDSSPRQY
jgi:hypothetical protein